MKDIAKWTVFGGIFIIPAVVLLVANEYFFPYITGKNFAFRIIVEIITAAWIILMLYDARYRPRFSWILVSFAAFMVVMFFANLFGVHPDSSFWSNFERMEGYVTLAHVFLYFIIVGSVMHEEKFWEYFFKTSLFVAVLLSLYAFGQISGSIEHRYGGFRVDATLGNATYMAVYMLFHAFIALYLLIRTPRLAWKISYGLLGLLFAYLLIQTATRGTTLGLVGGLLVTTLYILLFAKSHPKVRQITAGALVVLAVLVGTFIALRDAPFVQNNPTLTRVANISLEEAATRFEIWTMAFQGVEERPILGWGQSNYNYVFNKYFEPKLHGQEAWFDRAHNIIMDWLIAGGVLGLVTYFAIILSALYYLFLRPLLRKEDESFTVIERGILIGLLAGYMIHNFVVFDNIVSYIFYASILGFIHSRVGTPIAKLQNWKIDPRIVSQVAAPVVVLLVAYTVYIVNVPSMQAAKDIIVAFRSQDPTVALDAFEQALERDSLIGRQEIREQMTQRLQSALTSPEVPAEVKERLATRIEEELLKEIEDKPGDARIEVFISSFYRNIGEAEKAAEHLATARELSPNKQLIIFEQGFAELQRQDYAQAVEFFKEAYELDTSFAEPRAYYAMALIYNDQFDEAVALLETTEHKAAFGRNQYAVNIAYQKKQYPLLVEVFQIGIEDNPTDTQLRTNLSYILNEMGEKERAVEVLRQAAEDVPSFEAQSQQFIANILGQGVQLETQPAQ